MNFGRKIKIIFPLKGEVWNKEVTDEGYIPFLFLHTQILDRNKDVNNNVLPRSKIVTTKMRKIQGSGGSTEFKKTLSSMVYELEFNRHLNISIMAFDLP